MKKIDFHIHTISTPSDRDFDFSLKTLKDYVEHTYLDAIAITNHNIFNKAQYLEISQSLEIVVFPGIEIDVDKTHILIISDNKNLSEFDNSCAEVTKLIPDEESSISVQQLLSIFPNLSDYIVIPHYKKSPAAQDKTLDQLRPHVYAGEVSAPKKFVHTLKETGSLVPLLFSDLRMVEDLKVFPSRQTYVDVGDLTLATLRQAIKDRNKVFLSKVDGHKFFEALGGCLKISTGLNIVLGERSSGKSFTLDALEKENESEGSRVKYIRQFSLLQTDDDDEKEFSKDLETTHSRLTNNHLKSFEEVVEKMQDVDLSKSERRLTDFVDSLLKNATEADKHDSFARAKLFAESKYSLSPLKSLENIINASVTLIENVEHEDIILRHIAKDVLRALLLDLIIEHDKLKQIELKKKYINNIVEDIKNNLNMRSSATPIKEVDFYKIAIDKAKVKKFNDLFNLLKKVKEFEKIEIQGFKKVAVRRAFSGAADLKEVMKKKNLSFSDAYTKYNSIGYDYLRELRKIPGLEEADYYKLFARVTYEVLNSSGYSVSGGERSEFRLLQEISDASEYDLLLIDEPESSFDNIFLHTKVNKLIKDISTVMPVVIVTHNSTVGASIKPDYLIYTSKERMDGNIEYKVYGGHPGDKYLFNKDNEKTENHKVMMDCLEAGDDPYESRRLSYEILKD